MSEKNRKTEIKEGGAYLGLPSPAQPSSSRPAQPGGGPAHLAPPLSSSSPTGERRVPTRAHRRARHLPPAGHLLLPRTPSQCHGDGHAPQALSFLLPPMLIPSSGSPSLPPNAAAAAAENHHGHRPPLASLRRFPAPPRPPLPPRQATHLRTRSIADAVVFFTTDAGDRPRRHHRRFAGRRTSPSTPACSASPP